MLGGLITLGIVISSIYALVVCYCFAKSRKSFDRNCFNPLKWGGYLLGHFLSDMAPPHVIEQLNNRLTDEVCAPCREAGYCTKKNSHGDLICGCGIPAKMYIPWEECADDNGWGKIIWDRKEYESLKSK